MADEDKPEYAWQSSVLRRRDDDTDFLIAFANGDRSPAVMLEVIRLLDSVLAIREVVLRALTESAIAAADRKIKKLKAIDPWAAEIDNKGEGASDAD